MVNFQNQYNEMIIKFAILITTKNRCSDLKLTLEKINHLIIMPDVECVICDDGSSDETKDFVQSNYPNIKLIRNETSKGYIHNRNLMLNSSNAKYLISLDDDAHFITENILFEIENHFENNKQCGVVAFRIYWGKESPENIETDETYYRVKGFVGCGHVWRREAWKKIPNYPEWFVFYGEEDFAAFQLFKNNWEVHYLPKILVHHRVNLFERKSKSDYQQRQRRSLSAGWCNYFLFLPVSKIPVILLSSITDQILNKVLKGNIKGTLAIIQSIGDLIKNSSKLARQSNRLTNKEYREWLKISNTKIYWRHD